MVVYLDDDEAVDVEQLSLDEARLVLARAVAQLSGAYNIAHAQWLRQEIAEVEGQIEWLEVEAAETALAEAADEYSADMWRDYTLGIRA